MQITKIDNYDIGRNCKPFIIAEAGINHNGDIEKAFEMIKIAKNAGANAVKFQTFQAEELVSNATITYTYTSQGKEITESMQDMFKRYEFSREEWFKIKKKCDEEKIMFLSSPSSNSDLKLLLELGIKAIKVGSDDFTSIPLINEYAKTGLPLILSCGMADLNEIHETVSSINKSKEQSMILLLCTSEYPTPPDDVNLLKFKTLSKELDIPLGFSDHTQGNLASSLAVAFGACVFEKHFTLDHNLPGPDHWFSEDPNGLKEWVDSIKNAHIMMGSANVVPTEKEKEIRKIARKSIVTLKDIQKGEIFDLEKIGIKRPGEGLSPKLLENILGTKATRDLTKNELLKQGDFQ